MLVSDLNRKHEVYDELKQFWADVELLTLGGYAIVQQASRFLMSRPAEPGQVYSARLARFSYDNVIGTVLGWYGSRLFEEEPQIYLRDENDKSIEDDPDTAKFLKNADRGGHTLTDVIRDTFLKVARDGSAYILMDVPRSSGLAKTFRAQKQMGELDPYLVIFTADQVINWSEDESGNLQWILISTQRVDRQFGQAPVLIDRWYYFDQTTFRIYESPRPEGQEQANQLGDDRAAQIVAEGRHVLADQNRVPVRKVCVPEELWLAWRVYSQIRDHLNQDNSHSWALMQSNLAVPVIIGDYVDPPKLSETAFIKLEKGAQFLWSEPAGNSLAHSADRIQSLTEKIHRAMYVLSHARTVNSTASAQSGISKQEDGNISNQALNGYGKILRPLIASLVEDAALVRGKTITADVQGLEFTEKDEMGEITTAMTALDADIPSDSFEKFIQKKMARIAAGSSAPPDMLTTFDQEIDAAPTKSERDALEQQQQQNAFQASLETSLAKQSVKDLG